MLTDQPIAHFVNQDDGEPRWHWLADHLRGVAELAAGFAKAFQGQEMARLAGLWHDLGKHSHAFQELLARAVERGPDAAREGRGRVDHSSAGAIWAWERLHRPGLALAFSIAGHHAGLADYSTPHDSQAALATRLRKTDLLTAAKAGGIPASLLEPTTPASPLPPGWDPALWTRMIFSCLVDADFLDTEAFMQPDQAARRGGWPALAELDPRLTRYLAQKTAQAKPSPVNQARAEVLAACREAATRPPGVHTLTVPTGGGKTLSSLAFALAHARTHGLERLIYVIPYTSIIEQTARVFREALGEDAVLEHHSNLDPNQDTYAADLASENWDAPVIVTTAVQFFESLFAARSGRCRKLHRIAGGVVVLDEAQLTPLALLQPILATLRELTAHYRVSLVVCTATQPAWDHPIQTMDLRFDGLPSIGELAPDPAGLHQRLQRVRVKLPPDLNATTPWEEIAQRLAEEPSALCIVNTRKQARELAALLPQAVHLSAAMCAQHRSEVIERIKLRLKDGDPTLVISTQLVECGVDFDFPVVYRALAGLDSIAQAAGRCNREGELPDRGRVVVFAPPDLAPPGHLRQAAECARRVLAGRPADPLAPELFTTFFRELYWLKGKDLDAKGILRLLKDGKFRSAAEAFRMIEEDGPPVLTLHGQGAELVDQLRREGPSRALLRRLQRYTVTVPARDSAAWLAPGLLELLPGDLLAQVAPGLYHPRFGLGETDDPWPPAGLIS